jgi:hypothetical protein
MSTGAAFLLTSTEPEIELESASDVVLAVGIVSTRVAESVSRVGWSTVCPFAGLVKPKVAEAASTATKKGVKRISLRSFDTSTHHVYCKSARDAGASRLAISFLFVVHCPLSAARFNNSIPKD